jgi:hypothetical protein
MVVSMYDTQEEFRVGVSRDGKWETVEGIWKPYAKGS